MESDFKVNSICRSVVIVLSKNGVRLYQVTNTDFKPNAYKSPQNRIIEQAFQNQDRAARLTDADGNVFVVDFESMREYPENKEEDYVYVIRRLKETGLINLFCVLFKRVRCVRKLAC